MDEVKVNYLPLSHKNIWCPTYSGGDTLSYYIMPYLVDQLALKRCLPLPLLQRAFSSRLQQPEFLAYWDFTDARVCDQMQC